MSRVTREGETSVSKLDELLQRQGINLRDSSGEFRNRLEVLQEIAKAEKNWSSTVSEAIKFELAGTRQKKTLNVVLREMDTIIERTNLAMNSFGATMDANAVFAESLAGKTNDFKNSMEQLFSTMVSSDALSNLIESGTEFADTLIAIENTTGILNATLLVSIPLFVGLRGEMLAMKAIGIIEFFQTFAVVGTQVTGVVGSQIVAFSALNVAMGGIAIVIAGIVGAMALQHKAQQELIQSLEGVSDSMDNMQAKASKVSELLESLRETTKGTEEYVAITKQLNDLLPNAKELIDAENMSLEEQAQIYGRLNAQKKQATKDEAEKVIAETSAQYEGSAEKIRMYNERIKEASEGISELIQKQADGIKLTTAEQGRLESLQHIRENNQKALKDLTTLVEAHQSAMKALYGRELTAREVTKQLQLEMDELGESIADMANEYIPEVLTEVQLLTRAFAEMSEQGKINGDTFALLIEKFPEIADNLSINQAKVEEYTANFKNLTREQIFIQQELTNRVIEETIKRITAYQEELKSLEQLISTMSFVDGGFELEKQYIRTTLAIETQADRLRDLKSQSMALNEVSKKSSTTKSKELNLLTAEELALQDINNQIERQQSIRSLAEGDREKEIQEINKLIGLYIQQQARLHDLNVARRQQLETGKLNAEEEQKLRQEIAKTSNEWQKTAVTIKNLTGDIDAINKAYEDELLDTLKQINKELEEQSDLLEKQSSKLYDKIKDQLEDQVDALEKARDLSLENAEINTKRAEEELENYQRTQDKLEQENRLKEKSLALDKAKLKLANIQAEKNVRIFRADAGGFVFEADPRELRKAQDEIDKLQKDYNDQVVSDNKKAEEQKLKDTVDKLKDQERAIKNSYNKQIKTIKNTLSELADITGMELEKQNSAWSTFIENNSTKIKGFKDEIAGLIAEIQRLNSQQVQIGQQIQERQDRIDASQPQGSENKAYSNPVHNNIAEAIRTGVDPVSGTRLSESDKQRQRDYLEKYGKPISSLDTGGVIQTDGIIMGHANEPVLNPAQTSKVVSALGMQVGSAMENARNLFSFANTPSIATAGSGSMNSGTTIENLNVSLPGVTDVPTFAREIQNIKRYFNNRSR